jgi:hypothetical protein
MESQHLQHHRLVLSHAIISRSSSRYEEELKMVLFNIIFYSELELLFPLILILFYVGSLIWLLSTLALFFIGSRASTSSWSVTHHSLSLQNYLTVMTLNLHDWLPRFTQLFYIEYTVMTYGLCFLYVSLSSLVHQMEAYWTWIRVPLSLLVGEGGGGGGGGMPPAFILLDCAWGGVSKPKFSLGFCPITIEQIAWDCNRHRNSYANSG